MACARRSGDPQAATTSSKSVFEVIGCSRISDRDDAADERNAGAVVYSQHHVESEIIRDSLRRLPRRVYQKRGEGKDKKGSLLFDMAKIHHCSAVPYGLNP